MTSWIMYNTNIFISSFNISNIFVKFSGFKEHLCIVNILQTEKPVAHY